MMVLARTDVERAVWCPLWQGVRKSLKGETTEDKLKKLTEYVSGGYFGQCGCDTPELRRIQALNYLTALTRGGQLDIIPAQWQEVKYVKWLLNSGKLVVRK